MSHLFIVDIDAAALPDVLITAGSLMAHRVPYELAVFAKASVAACPGERAPSGRRATLAYHWQLSAIGHPRRSDNKSTDDGDDDKLSGDDTSVNQIIPLQLSSTSVRQVAGRSLVCCGTAHVTMTAAWGAGRPALFQGAVFFVERVAYLHAKCDGDGLAWRE